MASVKVSPFIEKLVKIFLRISPLELVYCTWAHLSLGFLLSSKISVTRESKAFSDLCFHWLVFVLLTSVNAEFYYGHLP